MDSNPRSPERATSSWTGRGTCKQGSVYDWYLVDIGVDRDFTVLPNGNDSSSVDVARPNVISPISRPPWHRRKVFENHLHIHHRNYSGNHVVSEYYLNEEANNTPFFLIPVTLVISLGYLFLPLD